MGSLLARPADDQLAAVVAMSCQGGAWGRFKEGEAMLKGGGASGKISRGKLEQATEKKQPCTLGP